MTTQRILPLAACLLALGLAPALAAPVPPAEHDSARYTAALNAFMAHGWHAVSDMHMKNGRIVASAVNSQAQMHSVTFDPSTGIVKQG
jgi:hypothetical protein